MAKSSDDTGDRGDAGADGGRAKRLAEQAERLTRLRKPPERQRAGGRVRRGSGYSLQALGEALGVHANTVGTWERGVAEIPVDKAIALAEFFGVPVAEVLGDDPPERAPTIDERLTAIEGLIAALAEDRREDDGPMRGGFGQVSKLISELRVDVEKRLSAQDRTLRTVLAELKALRQEGRSRATPDRSAGPKRKPRESG